MDQITLEAARRGDRQAMARLLRELQDPWYRLCLGLLRGREDDARDAVQETALRFVRDISKFRGGSSISTWSMGIAINVTREIRRKSRHAESYSDDLDEPATNLRPGAGGETVSPLASAVRGESIDSLRASMGDLSDRQREAIVLRFFEDLSVEETACAMGCAAGTVKATVHQALRILKTKLAGQQGTNERSAGDEA